MKKGIISFFILLCWVAGWSQTHDPVQWKTSVSKISDGEYELTASASIQNGWRIYSQTVPSDGPVPTHFAFAANDRYTKDGKTKEEPGNEIDDKMFNMRIKYFDGATDFKQRIQVKKPSEEVTVNAVVEYMVCNDTQCLPPRQKDLVFQVEP